MLGYAAAALRDGGPRAARRLRFVATGFCGALTTFSTLQLELLRMLDAERYGLAAAYALASVTLGLAAVGLGRRLAGAWAGRPPRGPRLPDDGSSARVAADASHAATRWDA